MPNYFTVTKNPIARAGIIRKLMAKGYTLYGKYTVSHYFNDWPAHMWPVVVVRNDATPPFIDLMMESQLRELSDAVRISPSQISKFPDSPSMAFAKEVEKLCPTPKLAVAAPVFPNPAKYTISYVKADGSMGNYTISNPIEASQDSITAYAFGRGIRTFKKARVRSFSKVG